MYLCITIVRHRKDRHLFHNMQIFSRLFSLSGDILITMSYIPVFFLLGIICFFICHLLFINGFCRKVPFNHKDILLFFIIYIPFTLFISINKYFSFNGYYFLVLIYSMVLTLMLSKSFSLITLKKHNKSAIYSILSVTSAFYLTSISVICDCFL